MRSIFLTILIMLVSFCKVSAQQKEVDSLKAAIKAERNDTAKIKLYSQLAFSYVESKWDSSNLYLDTALQLSRRLQQPLSEAIFLDSRGYILMQLGNYSKSLQSSLMALKLAEQPGLANAGTKSTPEASNNRRLYTLANIHYNIGLLYAATGNLKKQVESFQTGLAIANSFEDLSKQSEIKLSLGNTYLSMGKLDSAMLLEVQALKVIDSSAKTVLKKYISSATWTIGKIFAKKQLPDSARKYFLKAIEESDRHNNMLTKADAALSLAQLNKETQRIGEARDFAWQAVHTYESLGRQQGKAAALRLLSSIYQSANKQDSALLLLQLSDSLKDNINKIERDNIFEFQNLGFEEQLKVADLEKQNLQTQHNIRLYSLLAGLAVILAIAFILYKNNKQKQQTNLSLQNALANLKETQAQLIQAEKMASLGELTAGIAHEIQNPLNFVNNFSELSRELLDELKLEKGKLTVEEQDEILKDVGGNLEKINHHGKRADAIVKGMLQHSRSSSGQKEPTDINALCDEYLRLSYHGMQAKDKSFEAACTTNFDRSIEKLHVIPPDIGRVILNLLNNAFLATKERKAISPATAYEPLVVIRTQKAGNKILISVSDNGSGIDASIRDKIFQPFFTTRPTGQGTGLGLSLSYDIMKAHQGDLRLESNNDAALNAIKTTFIVELPAN